MLVCVEVLGIWQCAYTLLKADEVLLQDLITLSVADWGLNAVAVLFRDTIVTVS